MAGKTGTAQVRVISKRGTRDGMTKNESLPWKLRDHALFIGFAPVDRAALCLRLVIEHGAHRRHPQVQMARDVLLFAQQRDPLGQPARLSGQRCRGCGCAMSVHVPTAIIARSARTLRAEAGEMNWGLVLLIDADRLRRLRHALFGGGRQLLALGGPQMVRFVLGFVILVAVALRRYRASG